MATGHRKNTFATQITVIYKGFLDFLNNLFQLESTSNKNHTYTISVLRLMKLLILSSLWCYRKSIFITSFHLRLHQNLHLNFLHR